MDNARLLSHTCRHEHLVDLFVGTTKSQAACLICAGLYRKEHRDPIHFVPWPQPVQDLHGSLQSC